MITHDQKDSDNLVRALAKGQRLRGLAVRAPHLVDRARALHGLSPTSTVALGQTLIMALLLANDLKTDDASLSVTIRGNGPLHTVLAVANRAGQTRGLVDPPIVDTMTRADGAIDVSQALGSGTLIVSRDDGLNRRPYTSVVKLSGDDLAADLATHLNESSQVPSVAALAVTLNPSGVVHAGGLIIQAMPGAGDDVTTWMDERAQAFPSLTAWFDASMTPLNLLDLFFGDPDLTYSAPQQVAYVCPCSEARMLDRLATLPDADLTALAKDPKGIEVTCHFCNHRYAITQAQLYALLTARASSQDTTAGGV